MAQYIKYESAKLMHFTVSYDVGLRTTSLQTNVPEDVLLVQFLLNGIFNAYLVDFAIGERLKLDGLFGRHTHYHLLLFQRQAFQMNPAMQALTGTVTMTIGGKDGTMKELNDWYFKANPQVTSMKDLSAVIPPGLLRKVMEFGSTDKTTRVSRGVRYE